MTHQVHTQIITSATATFGSVGDPGGDGSNIMFPCIVKAASWHVAPRGTYYCLFGHHDGTYIRLAYSNSVTSGWTVLAAGTSLTLAALNTAGGYTGGTHVSSPHIIVDDVGEKYYCYLHGDSTGLGHESVLAESIDLETWTFVSSAARLSSGTGMIYVRPFLYSGAWYAISDTLNLFRSTTPTTGGSWARQSSPTTFRGSNGDDGRHAAAIVRGSTLLVLWTNRNEYGEYIHYASVDLTGSWEAWAMGPGDMLTRSLTAGDGADTPWKTSGAGASSARERALRDPGFFVDGSTVWLAYAQAGEDSIGVIDATAWLDANFPE